MKEKRFIHVIGVGLIMKREEHQAMGIFKLHFIRCVSIRNAGDMACDPSLYFDYFKKNYLCSFHDLGNVDFNDINIDDVVIIGAGGLLDVSRLYSVNINLLLDRCKNVILWSAGHNKHFDLCEEIVPIQYDKFKLIGVRDYNYKKFPYLPCVTCMHSGLSKRYERKRKVGIIEHTNYPIREFSFERISNSCSLENIIEFIGSSEVIITNSYHCVYWATLMSKKVILYNTFSEKFNYFKYPPRRYSGNIEEDIKKAVICEEFQGEILTECRKANETFFNKVIAVIKCAKESSVYTRSDFNYEYAIRSAFIQLNKLLKGKKVVIYGGGEHTYELLNMLSDDIKVTYITGKNVNPWFKFTIPFVKADRLQDMQADVLLLSSYKYRDSMKQDTLSLMNRMEIIELYDYFETQGLSLKREFYKYFSRTWLQNDYL